MAQWLSGSSKIAPSIPAYPEFEPGHFDLNGEKRAVYKAGSGPAIIVIHEIPGLYDKVLDFARRLNRAGYTTYLPSFTGTPGKALSNTYGITEIAKLCIAREFNRFAQGKEAPVANWLRALANHAHDICGGPGVGAVGMCFSGGFALAMMADSSVIAPVLSQPSMPFALTKKLKSDIDVNPQDIPKIKAHMDKHDSCLLGLRFTGDPMVPVQRFEHLQTTLGERFVAVNIDSSPGNIHGIKANAHSVLANDFVDEPSHPTYQALTQVLDLFNKQLTPIKEKPHVNA